MPGHPWPPHTYCPGVTWMADAIGEFFEYLAAHDFDARLGACDNSAPAASPDVSER